MNHCIIITHGPIGYAMIEAVESITGGQQGLHAISVTDMSATEIRQRLLAIVEGMGRTEKVLVLASLRGGSCWNVSAAIAQNNPKVAVISGVNLAMVLSFVTQRDTLAFPELVRIVERDGLIGIRRLQTER